MSKRIVELTCGDPKSNQQTASKVECVVNINNNGSTVGTRTVKVTDDGFEQYHSDEQTQPAAPAPAQAPAQAQVMKSLFVRRDINPEAFETPAAAEGYIQTASRPTITEAEIRSSVKVKDALVKGFSNLLRTNDCALLAQPIAQDEERKIVLMLPDFKALIGEVIRLVEPTFKDEEIRIRTIVNDYEIGCCGMGSKKVIINPLNQIESIIVGNQDMKIHQFEAYNTIEKHLNVSMMFVYSVVADKIMNEIEV